MQINCMGENMYNVKCRIADFNILFETDIKHLDKIFKEYLYDFNTPDITVGITDKDINFEKEMVKDEAPKAYLTTYKITALFRKLADNLPERDSFVLHSACFDIGGTGVAFAAHSGTGKTTHMNLWQKYLGDKMTVVNGDKPMVRFFDDKPETPYAYGTPWNGKEKLGTNMQTKLKHICFIERSKTNYVEKADKKTVIERIFKQVYMPTNPIALTLTMQLVDRLLANCDLWIIHCNMDEDAGKIAYNTIFNIEL